MMKTKTKTKEESRKKQIELYHIVQTHKNGSTAVWNEKFYVI